MSRTVLQNIIASVFALAWIAGSVAAVDWGARNSLLLWVEHWSGDWRTAFFADRRAEQHPGVALVTITEETLAPYPYRIPPDREMLARTIEALDTMGDKAIGIDFLILSATEPDKDRRLARAIRNAKTPIVLAVADKRTELLEQESQFQTAFLEESNATPGYANLLTGGDKVVRYLAPPADDGVFTNTFAAALAAPDAPALSEPRRIAWLLKPSDGSDTFTTVPAQLIAPPGVEGPSPLAAAFANVLKDRVVIVGTSLPDVDRHWTPLPDWEGEQQDGVFLQAQVVAQILDGRDILRVPRSVLAGLYGLLIFLGFFLGLRYGLGAYTLYGGTALLLIALVDIALFATTRQFIPYQACIVALLFGLLGALIARRLIRLA